MRLLLGRVVNTNSSTCNSTHWISWLEIRKFKIIITIATFSEILTPAGHSLLQFKLVPTFMQFDGSFSVFDVYPTEKRAHFVAELHSVLKKDASSSHNTIINLNPIDFPFTLRKWEAHPAALAPSPSLLPTQSVSDHATVDRCRIPQPVC